MKDIKTIQIEIKTLALSNTTEIVENESSYKLSPLQWSKFNPTFV